MEPLEALVVYELAGLLLSLVVAGVLGFSLVFFGWMHKQLVSFGNPFPLMIFSTILTALISFCLWAVNYDVSLFVVGGGSGNP